MTRLSDTQRVILSGASQRTDGAVLPFPETLKITVGTVNKVLGSLKAKGLIEHQGAPCGDDPPPLRITRAGLEIIGVEPEGGEASNDTAAADDVGSGAIPAKTVHARTTTKGKVKEKAKPVEKPTRRTGTKQAKMIALLRRPKGATVEQISAATGWQHHTIRGAVSGALKKKLGLKVESKKVDDRGRVYRIAG
jgi:hypothetical protein